MCCVISKAGSGIKGAGGSAFLSALKTFDSRDPSTLGYLSFVNDLLEHSTSTVQMHYSVAQISNELRKVSKWFMEDATYYDDVGNIVSVSGRVIEESNANTICHLNGNSDPKTRSEFTPAQKMTIESFHHHNLLHNSTAKREEINELSLPEGKATLNECKVDELKVMVIARGGGVTAKGGKALSKSEL